MVAQFDPPASITQARAMLTRLYNAPPATPPQAFNVQQPLPPVPYTNTPEFQSFLDSQPKSQPTPKTAPTTPTTPPQPLSTPKGATPPPPTINPVPRVAPPSGGGAAVVTLTGGGVISGAGLLTGGLATLAGGLLLYDAWQAYKLFKLSQPEVKVSPRQGGYENCVPYDIEFQFNSGFKDHYTLYGPIGDARIIFNGTTGINQIFSRGDSSGSCLSTPQWVTIGYNPGQSRDATITITKITRADKKPEPPQPPQPKRSLIKPQIAPSATPQGSSSPSPNGVRSPTSPPAPADNPLATNNRIPYTITTPGAGPITITSPGAAPVTITPTGQPATIKVTRPSASPFLSPTPTNNPAATPQAPATPAGVPITVASPGSTPTNLVMPGANPITINYPGQEPIVIDPTISKPPSGVQATPIQPPGAFITTPINPTQAPTTPTTPTTKPSTTPTTTPDNPFADLKDPDLQKIGLGLVGLTALLQGVGTNTSPQAIKAAAGAAGCQNAAPGGCSTTMTNNAVAKGNDDLKDFLKKNGLDAAAQAEQLRLLNQLDGKMGAQMPGGVTGAIGRLSKFLGVDRIFNLINFMANLHNAFMLSNSLKITLLEMLSSVGNATGLLQTAEGENVDLNEVYNQGVRALINSVLGDEQAARLEIQFRRANRIYQAVTNSTNAISGMMSSLGNVVEISAEYGGKIGNALKAAGAVHEKAYQWMAEKFDAKVSPFMKYSQTVNGVNIALETVNEIAQSVVEGQQAATEFQKANTDFLTAVAEVKKNPGIENKAVAEQVAKQKENATKDPTGEDETGLLSFLTDL